MRIPGQGDIFCRAFDLAEREYERDHALCRCCEETKSKDDMVGEFPEANWNLCLLCRDRLRPMCACGCGRLATIIADVRWPGGIDCRSPWVDIEHALESVTRHTPERPSIDVIIDAHDLPKLIALVPHTSPCWCDIEAMTCFHGYEYHTRLTWCPTHGTKE